MDSVTISNDRPIVFFDLETTGTNVALDRIVEIGAIKIHVDQSLERLHYLVNPGIPIPIEASAVHGIYDNDVANVPSFIQISAQVQAFFNGSDLGGYNITKFDIPLLVEELLRAGQDAFDIRKLKVVDVCSIFHQREPRDLNAAVMFYTGEVHESAHSAMGDVEATLAVLSGQIAMYGDLKPNVGFLHSALWGTQEFLDAGGWFLRGAKYKIYFSRGKHRGKCVEEEIGYLDWMKGGSEIPLSTKRFIEVIHQECKWREEFRAWLKKTGQNVTIPFLDSLMQCLKSGESCDVIMVVKNDDEATFTLRCGEGKPAEFIVTCKDCIDYLVAYIIYAVKEMEKEDLDTRRYGTLLAGARSAAQMENHEEGLVSLYHFLNTGLQYTKEDFHHQLRFKKLHQDFDSAKRFVAHYIEQHNYAAPADKLKYIYNEGVAALCLDLEMFFDKHEKEAWTTAQ